MDWRVVLLPLLVLQTAVLSLGVGLVMSALTAKYRDLTHLSALLIQVWMYATPVIYPLSEFPVRLAMGRRAEPDDADRRSVPARCSSASAR